jgi:hypothetical protein
MHRHRGLRSHKSGQPMMRLKLIIPTAGCTCLSAVAAETSAPPREEENLNLRRNRKHQNTSREQNRELQLFDNDYYYYYYDEDNQLETPFYRLKLYWESGYKWQGDDDDPFYCIGTFLLSPVCKRVRFMSTD